MTSSPRERPSAQFARESCPSAPAKNRQVSTEACRFLLFHFSLKPLVDFWHEIDIPNRSINVKLNEEELAARPMTPVTRNRVVSKSLRAYASMVSSADKGGVRII